MESWRRSLACSGASPLLCPDQLAEQDPFAIRIVEANGWRIAPVVYPGAAIEMAALNSSLSPVIVMDPLMPEASV